VNLDPHRTVSTWINLDLSQLGLTDGITYEVTELITGNHWSWTGARHHIQINPMIEPAWILSLSPLD
jgi:hypothetical protein